MIVLLSTTTGFGELRHVRRRDVDLKKRSVLVRDGAKNFFRDRTIPLNPVAFESMSWIIDRWGDLGGTSDAEFIRPHRPWGPQRSMDLRRTYECNYHRIRAYSRGRRTTAFSYTRLSRASNHETAEQPRRKCAGIQGNP
jgi:hypothetical protein